MRLLAWLRKIYRLLVLLAAIFGVQPGKPQPAPPAPTPPAVAPAPSPVAPAPPARKVIGGCATGDIYQGAKRVGFSAACVVDSAMYVIPPPSPTGFPTRAAAQQAIRDFRAANP